MIIFSCFYSTSFVLMTNLNTTVASFTASPKLGKKKFKVLLFVSTVLFIIFSCFYSTSFVQTHYKPEYRRRKLHCKLRTCSTAPRTRKPSRCTAGSWWRIRGILRIQPRRSSKCGAGRWCLLRKLLCKIKCF